MFRNAVTIGPIELPTPLLRGAGVVRLSEGLREALDQPWAGSLKFGVLAVLRGLLAGLGLFLLLVGCRHSGLSIWRLGQLRADLRGHRGPSTRLGQRRHR